MNFTPTTVLVCLLAFDALNAHKFSRRESGGLSRRAQGSPLTCTPCVLEPIEQLQPLIDALAGLEHTVEEVKGYINELLDTTFDTTDELQGAIEQNVDNLQLQTDGILGKLIKAARTVESCPTLQTLFVKFRTQLDMLLVDLKENWVTSVTNTDPASVFDSLAKAMAPDIPIFIRFIRDMTFYFTDTFLTDECERIAPSIFAVMNPKGNLSTILTEALKSSGPETTDLMKNIFGSILTNGGIAGEGLDVLYMFNQLLCGALQAIKIDPVQATQGYCPTSPEGFDYESIIYHLVCGILDLVGKQILTEEEQQYICIPN